MNIEWQTRHLYQTSFSRFTGGIMNFVRAIDLKEATDVLVRFRYTNQAIVPNGLRQLDRPAERELISKRMRAMGVQSESATHGKQVINNLPRTQVAVLRKGLVNNGLRLVDAHTSCEKAKHGSKYITTMSFRKLKEGEPPLQISNEGIDELRGFSMDSVWTAHIWWNPNGVMVIELVQRQPGVVPQYAIVVRDGWIVAAPTERLLEENEEDMQIGALLLEELESLRVA